MDEYDLEYAIKLLHTAMKLNLITDSEEAPYLKAEIAELLDNTDSLWPGGFENDWMTDRKR